MAVATAKVIGSASIIKRLLDEYWVVQMASLAAAALRRRLRLMVNFSCWVGWQHLRGTDSTNHSTKKGPLVLSSPLRIEQAETWRYSIRRAYSDRVSVGGSKPSSVRRV